MDPTISPYESCICCMKGDTATGLALAGSGEWKVAALVAMGVAEVAALIAMAVAEEATAPFQQCWQEENVLFVRVCADCASRAHMEVAPVKRGALPAYREPAE